MNSPFVVHDKTITTMVRNWAWRQRGKAFCDDCIASKLGIDRKSIVCVTTTLGGSAFLRIWGGCAGCGKQTMVSSMVTDGLVA